MFTKHKFNGCVTAYVKNEGNIFLTMTFILTSVASCEVLGLLTPFVRSCRGHAMSKCCQHVIDDSKVCFNLTLILIKDAKSICKRSSHGPKNVVKDGNKKHLKCEGDSTQVQDIYEDYICFKMHPILRNFWIQMICCKNQQSLAFQGYVPSHQVWAIAWIVFDILGLMVQQSMLNHI